LIECNDNSLLERDDVFYVTEGNNKFEFRWVQITDVKNQVIYPTFIKDRIADLPVSIERIVDTDV